MRKPTQAVLCALAIISLFYGCSDDSGYPIIQHQFGVIHDPDPPKTKNFDRLQESLNNGSGRLKKWASVKKTNRDTTIAFMDTATYNILRQIHESLSKKGYTPDWEVSSNKKTFELRQVEYVYSPIYKQHKTINHGDSVYACDKMKKMNDILGFGGRWVLFGNHVTKDKELFEEKCPHHDHDE